MKKKTKKLALNRETLQHLTGADRAAIGVNSADPCVSCLCVSDPETVCLCSGGGVGVEGIG